MNTTRPRADGRVVFLDVARVIATLVMVFDHTVDALLASAYRGTQVFNVWTFFRGLTPTTFMFVSGFALCLVVMRSMSLEHAARGTTRRLTRFGFFLVAGYVLHYPWKNLAGLRMYTAADLRLLTAVDVLQCVAVSLVVLQVLAHLLRTPRRFLLATATLAVVFCVGTPLAWRYTTHLPLVVSAYLNPSTGSIFPLFPWLAYPALGAATGVAYLLVPGLTPGAKARRSLLPLAVALLAAGAAMRLTAWEPFGGQEFPTGMPSLFCLQVGLAGLLLTALATVMDVRPARLPVVEEVAQQSLVIYYLHLCIVYGSPWNVGMRQFVGSVLSPLEILPYAAAVLAGTVGFAIWWTREKRAHPARALRMRNAVFAVLFVFLLV